MVVVVVVVLLLLLMSLLLLGHRCGARLGRTACGRSGVAGGSFSLVVVDAPSSAVGMILFVASAERGEVGTRRKCTRSLL